MSRRLTLSALFQRNLRAAMEHRRVRQLRLAQASSVAQTSIGRILRGEQTPTLDVVERLAAALDLEPWMMLVAGFTPGNPPGLKPISHEEEALYERLRLAAQDLASYKLTER
jgi:transcriptional regulator with XRE-family HTH domain